MGQLWFRRKRYGWGWRPVTWQGWVLVVVYIVLIAMGFRCIDVGSHSASDTLINFVPYLLILTSLIVFICYLTGEKPRWQWGDKPNQKQ